MESEVAGLLKSQIDWLQQLAAQASEQLAGVEGRMNRNEAELGTDGMKAVFFLRRLSQAMSARLRQLEQARAGESQGASPMSLLRRPLLLEHNPMTTLISENEHPPVVLDELEAILRRCFAQIQPKLKELKRHKWLS